MTTVILKQLGLYTLILAFGLMSCNNEGETKPDEKSTGKPVIEFNKTSHDFGDLKEGEIVECSFYFKNTGKGPLLIKEVTPDCGCTVPEFDKEAILPGEESKIKIVFNSAGFRNNIYKTIDVETNTEEGFTELILTAFIISENTLAF